LKRESVGFPKKRLYSCRLPTLFREKTMFFVSELRWRCGVGRKFFSLPDGGSEFLFCFFGYDEHSAHTRLGVCFLILIASYTSSWSRRGFLDSFRQRRRFTGMKERLGGYLPSCSTELECPAVFFQGRRRGVSLLLSMKCRTRILTTM
jgi:hypothetical protein